MRWRRGGGRGSDVIDVRGGGGRGMGLPIGGGAGVLGLVAFLLVQFLGGGGAAFDVPGYPGGAPVQGGRPIPASQDPERDLRDFSAYVFSDVQDKWARALPAQGTEYRRAKLVLYRRSVGTGCGFGSAASGPFYCPADERVYLDLSFYGEMERRLRAGGDFAWAYVIAHEVGHHVQRVLGTEGRVRELQRQRPGDANSLSVRLELQADCYAGVWARTVYEAGDLEAGDVEEAMAASAAVGDDRLQEAAGRRADPDSFTHGTSAQRTRWFEAGRRSGAPSDCDTFAAENP